MSFSNYILLTILTFSVILSGPLLISYGSSLPCSPEDQKNRNIFNLVGSLLLALGVIIFNSLNYKTDILYDIFLYIFLIGGALILNYGIAMVCNNNTCETDRINTMIAGGVISFIGFGIVLLFLRRKIFFVMPKQTVI